MSLIISLEDATGKDVNLEVLPDDTFEEFTARASEILGYTVELSSISGDNPVLPTDNVYDYLLQMASLHEVQEESESMLAVGIEESQSESVADFQMTDLNNINAVDYVYEEIDSSDNIVKRDFQSPVNVEGTINNVHELESAHIIREFDGTVHVDEMGNIIVSNLNDQDSQHAVIGTLENMIEDDNTEYEEIENQQINLGDENPSPNLDDKSQPTMLENKNQPINVGDDFQSANLGDENQSAKLEDINQITNVKDENRSTNLEDENQLSNREGFDNQRVEEMEQSFTNEYDMEDMQEEHLDEDFELNEKKKMESDLLSIINKSSGVIRTIKLDDYESEEYLEEYLEEFEDEVESSEMEEGEIPDDIDGDFDDDYNDDSSYSNYEKYTSLKSKKSENPLEKEIVKEKSVIEDEEELPVYDSSEGGYTDVEFLDEEVIKDHISKVVIKEEPKEPDLEDDIDTFTIIKHAHKSESNGCKVNNVDKQFNELFNDIKTEKDTKDNNNAKKKPAYTRKQLLDLLEGESDEEGKSSTKQKSKGSNALNAFKKQEKLNKNDFSKEFEKIAKMGVSAYELKSFKDEPCQIVSRKKPVKKKDTSSCTRPIKEEKNDERIKTKENTIGIWLSDETVPGGYKCRICNKIFDKLLFAITHTMVHKMPGKPVYPCVLCEYGFTSYPQVRDHMTRAHLKGNYPLPVQKEAFKISTSSNTEFSNKRLTEHTDKNHNKGRYTKKQKVKKEEVEMLEEWLDDEVEMVEEWLDDQITIKDDMEQYYEENTSNADGYYSESCNNEDALLEEWIPPSAKKTKLTAKPKVALDKSTCTEPLNEESGMKEEKVDDEATLLVVKKDASKGTDYKVLNLYRCALCGQAFPTPRRLVYHRSVHQAELIDMNRCCVECERDDFPNEISLYDHMNDVHNRLFRCREGNCKKEFQLRSSLKIHAWVHGKRRLKCDVCLKQFPDSQILKDHKITHLKVKPFQCHICLKYINRRNRLRMHLLAHESSRPKRNSVMSCKHCQMAFKSVLDARDHILENIKCRLYIDPKGIVDISTPSLSQVRLDTVEMDLERMFEDEEESKGDIFEKGTAADNPINDFNRAKDANGVDESIEDISVFINDSAKIQDQARAGDCFKDDDKIKSKTIPDVDALKDEEDVIKTAEEVLLEIPPPLRVFIDVEQLLMVYRCEFCEKVFCTMEGLNNHRVIHQNIELPYECNVCHLSFQTYARVTSHKVSHGFYKLKPTEEGDIEVQDDGQVHEKSAAQLSGYDKFPVVKYFLCQICNRTFLHHTYYSVHCRMHHGPVNEKHLCGVCEKMFASAHLLNVHTKRVHCVKKEETLEGDCGKSQPRNTKPASTNYRCMECDENFTNRSALIRHRKVVHNDLDVLADLTGSGPFTCHLCFKVYQTKVGLEGHIRVHKGMLYLCALCGSGFAHQAGLDTHHKRVHLRRYSHNCSKCSQSFFSVFDLQNHMRSHTGEKPFPCPYCKLAFRTKSRRAEHLRVHTDERPFPCDICGLAFRRSIAMKNHRLIHLGHRPHVCQYCTKRFHIKSALSSHIKNKHSSKYLFVKMFGGPTEQAVLEECLNSLVGVTDKEEEEEESTQQVEIEQDHQIVFSLNPVAGDDQTQHFVQVFESEDHESIAGYQMEEIKGDDGHIKYQVKFVS